MSWTRQDLKRSYPCNAELIKYLCENRNWSQRKLAEVAGYSERLIGKVESGGSVATATIEILAKAFSSTGCEVYPEDLISDPVAQAKTFVEAFYELQRDMVGGIRHLLDDEVVFHFLGDPKSVPFAGTHHGVDEFTNAINRFFDKFEIVENPDGAVKTNIKNDFRFIAQGKEVVVWGEAWIQPVGSIADKPVPVTQRMRFRRGKLFEFEDRFDLGGSLSDWKSNLQ